MNIEPVGYGINFSFDTITEVTGPELPSWQLRHFWRCYWETGDRGFGMVEFFRLVRMGHIVCSWLLEKNEDEEWCVSASVGIELMRDQDGPYTQFCFFARDTKDRERGALGQVLPGAIMTAWEITKRYSEADAAHEGPLRMYIAGRKGWRRVIEWCGIEMEEGWISSNQEFFNYGPFRRQ